jgi:HD-GYP domain-containing protein (c-di-GMP phosphodiesterase class II)
MNEAFYPIRLNTLRSDEKVLFDVYLKLGSKFLHYTHSQDEMEGLRLKNLKSKGVRKLFIRAEDETTYLLYLEKGLENLSDKSKDLNDRGAMAHDVMILSAENAQKIIETEEGYNNQKKQFDKISEFIISDKNALKSMLTSAGISVDNNHHAANVSSMSLGIAARMGMTDKIEIFELGTAALLHDIGKSRSKIDPMKSREQMTPEELKEFKNHPQDGADMLAGKPYISPRVLGLIQSHEEYGEGRGFPEKKNIFKLALSYQILNTANHFDHFASEHNLALADAIEPFTQKFGKDFDYKIINILTKVLK